MDWAALLYAPIYDRLGVPAVLTLGTDSFDITVIDKTAGIAVGDGVEVLSIKPACDVLVSGLTDAGVTRADLTGGQITFNSQTWTITHNEPRPSPSGESAGELRLFLSE